HDDLIVGAPFNSQTGDRAGRAYVVSGADGSTILELAGERAGDNFGSAVAGRVLDDGRAILVAGAPNAGDNYGGRVYVWVGEPHAGPATFTIETDETGAELGAMFLSIVGDVDADGHPDVYASDWSNNARGGSTGRVYVHSGATGARLYTFTGEARGDGFGIGPADAGDVDGDGHDDLVIGAWQHWGAAAGGGKVYVFSGADGSVLREITGKVMGDAFGFDATGMGDVDGDGAIDYLITSASSAVNGTRSGRVYIISGAVRDRRS
ncbi:MAG: integrin alpha, partial [Gemmatimonadota bacterium]|nr:integrin alpha [Gemmatimonadota bacterium]